MTATQTAPTETAVDPIAFRNVVGHFASGVTVITTVVDGQLYGTTASAVSSLSMEPPMMLACLNGASSTHDAVATAGVFGINILAEDQADLAMKFGRKGADKFDGVAHTLSDEGVPLLDGALATIVCKVAETATGGTHTVFLGLVTQAAASERQPLAYYRGTMGRLEPVKELAAYNAVRDWVLLRKTPLGQNLNPADIAVQIRAEADQVQNALVKLTTEALVSRTEDGAFVPTPITCELIESVYDGRATIESGVIASHLERLTDQDVSELERLTAELGNARQDGQAGLDDFLKLNVQYHDRLVNVAGSAQLSDAFRRLGIGTVWRQALEGDEWSRQMDHSHIVELTAALAARDGEAAVTALSDHTEFGKSLAREVIERHGGAV
ncbi:flavin reductase [Arthrobacter crystallopoietes]|uniref:flavin reductase n=1 Tax=Crystallibacter crystallopoietes TaxID=37928 RepID=UPI0011114CDF|nr:flavin reductase [Arthrobacter crystallopoietes]QTG81297.1 flavin reductase [Arthrobacter crystallopoietes]